MCEKNDEPKCGLFRGVNILVVPIVSTLFEKAFLDES